MPQDPEELRVEHILAALDQIETLSAQLRQAMSVLDPGQVLARPARFRVVPPPPPFGVIDCGPPPLEPRGDVGDPGPGEAVGKIDPAASVENVIRGESSGSGPTQ
jgi:hypothetical protein